MSAPAHPADEVWLNGRVRTMDPARPVTEALAVRDGQLLCVGSTAEALATCGDSTRRIDLEGAAVLPGLIDTHQHPLWGAVRDLFEVYVGLGATMADLLQACAARAARDDAPPVIAGGPWQMRWMDGLAEPPRLLLDRHTGGRPAALREITYHSLWLNSAALRECGVNRATPDPAGGRIGRDASGEPDGILYEQAQRLAVTLASPGEAQLSQAARRLGGMLHANGITAVKEALAGEPELRAYVEADRAGALNLHVAAHMARVSFASTETVAYEKLEAWRSAYRTAHVNPGFVKLFLDGVAPSRTAAFLEPYLPCPGCAPGSYVPEALLLYTPQALAEELVELDRRGFVVKMHAVGDRATRAGLDAIEAARRANGASGLRHEIAHTAFVHESDHRRFAQLDAVAEVSPRLWFPNPVTPGQYAVIGRERTERCHQIRSLLEAGAEMTYGSDWPAAAADPSPWVGLAGMLNRRNPLGLFPGTIGEGQAITLERALPLFTTNAARSMGMQSRIGALAPGRSADFVVLDRPLEEMTPAEIGRLRVRRTVFEGRVVYERS